MKTLIYEGFLNRREYYHLLLRKRKRLIFAYLLLLLVDIASAVLFSLTFVLNGWIDNLTLRIVFIAACALISICMGLVYFFTRTTGIRYIYGDVKVYKNDNELIVNSKYKGKSFSYTIIVKEKAIESNHLLIRENRSKFIYLPKELLNKIWFGISLC